jgi:hypothetical protein
MAEKCGAVDPSFGLVCRFDLRHDYHVVQTKEGVHVVWYNTGRLAPTAQGDNDNG